MGEPVKVEVIGQVLPGSVLRVAEPFDAENWDVVVEAVRQAAGHDRFVVMAGDIDVEPPVADPVELSALGVVQEVNRRMLHPVGLKLGYRPGEPFLFVYDDRDDPEGVRFEGLDLTERQAAFDAMWAERTPARRAALGYDVQPLDDPAAVPNQ